MAIKDELLALKQNGVIQAESGVLWAKDHPESDLYRSLEWDNEKAGHQHRIWQVRRLIAIHIVSDEGLRQVVSLSIDRTNDGGGYRPLSDVLPKSKLRDVMIADCLAELERIQNKYNNLQELAEVWAAKDKVRRQRKIEVAQPAQQSTVG